MTLNISSRRRTAITLLLIWIIDIVVSPLCYALTSGPVQPESKGFQPAGVSDMVDLFSGDFKYNVPLLEVDGYPVNLNYQSGSGIDDEASWVGLGWNLNVGSINRQLRGIPDDFSGDEAITEHYTRPKVTVGGRGVAKVESFGGNRIPGINGSVSFGVFSDNYTGIGAELGANAGLSFSFGNGGILTSGMGVGVLSSTASGVDFSPYLSMSIKSNADRAITGRAGVSASLGYNTRSGMKSLTLGSSFGANYKDKQERNWGSGFSSSGSFISFNTEPINPSIQIPYTSKYGSFSFDGGGAVFGLYFSGGLTGYRSVRAVASKVLKNQAYGFLYAEKGKDQKGAIMDFTREKENPIMPESPNLAIPVHTPDLFSYTSQAGGGQFRLYRGTGILFDNEVNDESDQSTFGLEIGGGVYGHGGGSKFDQSTKNSTRKWKADNAYLKKGDFQDYSKLNPGEQQVGFKVVGEKSLEDVNMTAKLFNTKPLALNISGKYALASFRDTSQYVYSNLPVVNPIKKQKRQVARTSISYLTAKEASKNALNKQIRSFPFNNAGSFVPSLDNASQATTYDRINTYKKPHHISELSVTDDAGKRMVYGLPVYNLKQDEYSFAAGRKGAEYTPYDKNQLLLSGNSVQYKRGVDHYFHKESQPAYAASFMLTSVLSPDYQDKTGDGISDDDQGTAIRFNYSKVPYLYRWRTPYSNATLNKSMLADPEDDKGSFVYGEKELWYIHTIESKTKIAYFITEDRNDGLGVQGFMGGQDSGNKQKLLREIRLYSKSDLSKPIKIVKFEYSYELCPGGPNSMAGGKLTLKKVYFQYGNTDKGKFHPYVFSYKQAYGDNSQPEPYGYLKTDRWGTFKPDTENQGMVDLPNDEFPYTIQDKEKADKNVAVWQLDKIELPTGGTIHVSYESDDYAFVQNKRAMVMTGVGSLINADRNDVGLLKDAKGIKLTIPSGLPQGEQTAWFKGKLLNGSDYLYARFNVKMSTPNAGSFNEDFDFVSSYCKVRNVQISGTSAYVLFEDIDEAGLQINPIQLAAWQRLKNEYPRYAYPGYENRVRDGDAAKAIEAAVSAIVDAVSNLSELKENFYKRAERKNFGTNVNLNKSFVRLAKLDGFKIGGGLRVKKISISDNWQTMTGDNTAPTGSYGQAYDYTTLDNGKLISSGVASYEPAIGNEENPMKQPIPYIQNIKGAINNYFSLEEPFGESFFPSASVGYSKVTVRDLKSNGDPDPNQQTGYIVNEFYTAREFPVRVTVLDLKKNEYKPKNWFSMFGASSLHESTYSQGYSIELNDMHGKPSAIRVFNKSDKEISSTVYDYDAVNAGLGKMRLKNIVNVINEDGSVENNRVIGRDIELFTDLREQESFNTGTAIAFGGDVFPIGWIPFPLFIPHWPAKENNDYRLFRSACAVKVIQYYGIIKKVTKTEDGASVSTENVAYDAITGEPLVTKTQNEFNQSIYSVNLPAYWMYKAMGGAYRNLGILITDLKVQGGSILGAYTSYLQPGDEIGDTETGERYWVIEGSNGVRRLIDRDGKLQHSLTVNSAKILRSGFKNMLSSSASTFVCLTNPIENNRLKLNSPSSLASLKVINASVNLFDERWAVEAEQASTDGNARYLVENTSGSFGFCQGATTVSRGAFLDFINSNTTGELTKSDFWGNGSTSGPFSRSSIWLCSEGTAGGERVEALSFDTCITIPQSKNYFIGSGSSGQIAYKFDNGSVGNSISGFSNRWIVAKHYLTAGSHRLRVTVYTSNNNPSNDYAGLEIYDNTAEQLKQANASGTGINILFSTAGIRNKADLKSDRVKYLSGAITETSHHYTEPNGAPADPCYAYSPAPVIRNVNPYLYGYLGNWRPSETKVYQEKRDYQDLFNPVKKGVNVKNAGTLSTFHSYWYHSGSSGASWIKNLNAAQWITANTVTLYDKYGQELENKDALGRYSSAKFDFNGELPSAVASNAMNREVYVASFEDSKFNSGTADVSLHEFTQIPTNQSVRPLTVKTEAHSGNYSLVLPAKGIALSTIAHNRVHKADNYLFYDTQKGFMTIKSKGLYPGGFEPSPDKKYVINFWIKDGQAINTSIPVSLSANTKKLQLKCRAISEGWKLIEGIIEIPSLQASGKGIEIRMVPSRTGLFVDDIRIFPFDAHMKSYAYDDRSLRLMAELDENSFATFYEYDDEGSLIRVKKETERGIVTLKETRSSYKKKL